jgi:putative peptidoglycan lipid II flippase
VLGGLVAALLIVGLGGNSTDKPDRSSPSSSGPAPAASGSVVKPTDAFDFDPEGDDDEHSEDVGLAIDGNPTGTAWTSEHYDTDTFAGTKSGPNPGVGLYVTAEKPATPSEIIVQGAPGWDAEIYASTGGPPEDLEGWGEPVGEISDAPETAEISLDVAAPSKYFLIWFTKAAPSRDQEGRFQLEISGVKLIE